MNIFSFDQSIKEIVGVLDLTQATLHQRQAWIPKERAIFDRSLETLVSMLKDESCLIDETKNALAAAHRFSRLSKIETKIKNIRRAILMNHLPRYFIRSIHQVVLPILSKRIGELKTRAFSVERLPFDRGKIREEYFQSVKETLSLQALDNIEEAEKEYFHILSNEFERKTLAEVDIERFEGNYEIYSLLSWREVLSRFFIEASDLDARTVVILKKAIAQALPLALKTSFFLASVPRMHRDNGAADKEYLADLCRLGVSSQDVFLKRYTLGQKFRVPINVLINEMAWDVVETIDQMVQGDVHIIATGTKLHRVTIEIKCIEQATSDSPGKYDYTIINGGEGARDVHSYKLDDGIAYVRPASIRNLPKSILSYSFFEQLMRFSLQGDSMTDFYNFHLEHLVDKGKGQVDLDSNPWVKMHAFGTCSYSSVEAWISTYLNPKQIAVLNLIKAKVCVAKQKSLVTGLEADCGEGGWRIIPPKASTRRAHKRATCVKRKWLKDNRLLLDLGRTYKRNLEIQLPHAS